MNDLDEIVNKHLDAWQLTAPTYAAAVFDRDGVIAFGGAAFDDRFEAPARSDVFRICSMSKSFLAASLLLLVHRGQLDLDSPVDNYIPEFTSPESGSVTVRMLLSNSSGLPEDNAWIDHHLALPMDEFRKLTGRGYRFTEIPGRAYQYSNVGFALAGQIVELVSEQPYETFLRQQLLEPLGLRDTRYRAEAYDTADHVLAIGRTTFDDGVTWVDREFVGSGVPATAGGLFSTVDDIAQWCGWLSAAMSSSEAERPSELLPASLRLQMQRIQTPIHSMQSRVVNPRNDGIGYGLGLIVEEDSRFGTIAQHSGGLPGFSTNMRWHADSGLGVVVYATTEGQPMAARASDLLQDVLLARAVPARHISLWPETFAAAERIDEMLRAGADFAEIDDLISDNVLYEVPAEVRRSRLQSLIADAGGLVDAVAPLSERMRWSVSAAQLVWNLPCRNGEIQVRIELASVPGTPVQRIETERPGAELSSMPEGRGMVVRHYLPVVDRYSSTSSSAQIS